MARRMVIYLLVVMSWLCVSCSQKEQQAPRHAMYYWSTTFAIDSVKERFIKKYDIERLYVRYFDVVPDAKGQPVPNATIKFDTTVVAPCEIVPVVYLHNDCMRHTDDASNAKLADNILSRILQISETHDIGAVREIQIDCDWTASTRGHYYDLLTRLVDKAKEKGIVISTTVRLHQLSQPVPPADRGVLMVYNTGDLTKYDEDKPILDERVVSRYLKSAKSYDLPMAAAYPIFKWDILFRNKRFVDLQHYPGEIPLFPTDTITERYATAQEIIECKRMVDKRLPGCRDEVILFDLNNYNIARYSDEEFEAFFD